MIPEKIYSILRSVTRRGQLNKSLPYGYYCMQLLSQVVHDDDWWSDKKRANRNDGIFNNNLYSSTLCLAIYWRSVQKPGYINIVV